MTIYQHLSKTQTGEDAIQIITFTKKITPDGEVRQYIKIETPGQRDFIERWITDNDKIRFSRQWQAYELQGENSVFGTPLAETLMFDDEILVILSKNKIHTVEQLAEMPDSLCSKIPDSRKWKERAQAVLDMRQSGKAYESLKLENEVLKEEMRELRRELGLAKEMIGSTKESIVGKAKSNKKTGQ